MNLPVEAINEFIALYKMSFGDELNYETAKVEAEIFLKLFDLIGTI